ncbi:uncharacterized protein LOC132628310 [Lycium barbarum]|uniref:uncharacterized protein LOC132628310 n=1 Tax=Lycium barbarum TaxID=112863 RepID=UPI00293EF024|nr:uncharacterized protein LOC132628310 [Lycium barbarum]
MVTWIMVCIRTVSYTLMLNGNLSETFPAKRNLDRGDEPPVSLIKEKFLQFSTASGLKANMSKSQFYFGGVTTQKQQGILGILGYKLRELPFKYLGIPQSTKRLTVLQCKPLANKITANINNWMAKTLSYARRIQLIKAVLFGVQAYWAQLFLLPKKVCLPRGAGGLNLLDLKIWNQAAICKLLWALRLRKEKLWITWIHTYYIKRHVINSMNTPSQASWMVRKIFNMRKVWHTMVATKMVQDSKFLISKVYTAIRGDVQNVEWKHLVCHNSAEPRQVFILWLQLWGRLRTKEVLLKWGLTVSPTCVLCDQAPENANHLFFECPYSQTLWREVLKWQTWCRRISS